jgi:hypothetical protein
MIEVQEMSVPEGLAEPHYDLGLYLLQCELQLMGMALETYSFTSYSRGWNLGGGNPKTMLIKKCDPAGKEVLYTSLSSSLNSNQLEVFKTIREEVDNQPKSAQFFLEGVGGKGKTFFYRTIYMYGHDLLSTLYGLAGAAS